MLQAYTTLSDLQLMTEQLLSEIVYEAIDSNKLDVNLVEFSGESTLQAKNYLDEKFGPLVYNTPEGQATASNVSICFQGPYPVVSVAQTLETRIGKSLPLHDKEGMLRISRIDMEECSLSDFLSYS